MDEGGLGKSGSVAGTAWEEAAQPQQASGRKVSAFDIGTSPSSSSPNTSRCAPPGVTHLNSSSTPSEASVLAGSTRIQGLRNTTPVRMEVHKLLDAHARSQLSRQAAAGERGARWKGGYRCQRSPAREWRRRAASPRAAPGTCSSAKAVFCASPPAKGTEAGEAESAPGRAVGEGAGEGEPQAKQRRASSGLAAPRSLAPAFRRDAAGADHVREPEPEPGRGGRAADRGWAIPPSFQILYKQTLARARRGGRRRRGTRTCGSQPPRSRSCSPWAARADLTPAEIPAPPLISPQRCQARDSGGEVAGARGFTPIRPWCGRERGEPGRGGSGRRQRRTLEGPVPPRGASWARVPPLRPDAPTPLSAHDEPGQPLQDTCVPSNVHRPLLGSRARNS
ncbi:translation initiation factor IF-2-like [Acinonyx jubatus]|uniref:Translation initiation factor IF-2-like n=1 Tax=Acinonyx jubatus TaxID=32536 RepID=A0ABM3PKE1_ACIJB|nr:translation initiation factor IF-2-like [Acinonyx jubatus]